MVTFAPLFAIFYDMTMLDLQPTLQDNRVLLRPLTPDDFEILYAIASDPLIWEQHPNKTRYQRPVFENYFRGAVDSKGAFVIIEKATAQPVGSTRFYDISPDGTAITIGYTFFARHCWGRGINQATKKLMIDYAFTGFNTVEFHIAAINLRSQIAIGRLGAIKIREEDIAYYGEPVRPNFVYQITRDRWLEVTKALG